MKKVLIGAVVMLCGVSIVVYHKRISSVVTQDLLQPAAIQIGNLLEEKANLPEPLAFTGQAKGQSLSANGVIIQTNKQRTVAGLPALSVNAQLTAAATEKLNDMFTKQYFEHVSPQGVGPSDLAKSMGYAYVLVGENLALGNFNGDAALVEAWMNSPGHRANILNTKYQEIGVAVKEGMYQGNKVWLAVQEFGTPLSSCPGVDAHIKSTIDANKVHIEQFQKQATILKGEIDSMSRADTTAYNAKVATYNELVRQTNTLLDETKQLVLVYNQQVASFNSCVNK